MKGILLQGPTTRGDQTLFSKKICHLVAEFISTKKGVHFQFHKGSDYPQNFKV